MMMTRAATSSPPLFGRPVIYAAVIKCIQWSLIAWRAEALAPAWRVCFGLGGEYPIVNLSSFQALSYLLAERGSNRCSRVAMRDESAEIISDLSIGDAVLMVLSWHCD